MGTADAKTAGAMRSVSSAAERVTAVTFVRDELLLCAQRREHKRELANLREAEPRLQRGATVLAERSAKTAGVAISPLPTTIEIATSRNARTREKPIPVRARGPSEATVANAGNSSARKTSERSCTTRIPSITVPWDDPSSPRSSNIRDITAVEESEIAQPRKSLP